MSAITTILVMSLRSSVTIGRSEFDSTIPLATGGKCIITPTSNSDEDPFAIRGKVLTSA
jgi:hypothetical protein